MPSAAPRCPRCHHLLSLGHDHYGDYTTCMMCGYQGDPPATSPGSPQTAESPIPPFFAAQINVVESHWVWTATTLHFAPDIDLPVVTWHGHLEPAATVIDHLITGQPRLLWVQPVCTNSHCVRPGHGQRTPIAALPERLDGLPDTIHLELVARLFTKTLTIPDGHVVWDAAMADQTTTTAPRPILNYKTTAVFPPRAILNWAKLFPYFPCDVSNCLNPRHRSPIMLQEQVWRNNHAGAIRPLANHDLEDSGAHRTDRPLPHLAGGY